jgi:hypothetical protein
MSALDRDVLAEKAQAVERHLARVADRLPPDPADFKPSSDASDAVVLHLWQATQIVIDLALAACVHARLGTPTGYADAFRRLERAGIVDAALPRPHSSQSSPNSSAGCGVRSDPLPHASESDGQYLSQPQQMRWGLFGATGNFLFISGQGARRSDPACGGRFAERCLRQRSGQRPDPRQQAASFARRAEEGFDAEASDDDGGQHGADRQVVQERRQDGERNAHEERADHRRRNAIARSLVLPGFRSVNHLAFAVQRKATDLLIVDLGSSGWRQSYGVPTPVTSR